MLFRAKKKFDVREWFMEQKGIAGVRVQRTEIVFGRADAGPSSGR